MTLKEWLESHDCQDVKPIRVTIGSRTYEGASYSKGHVEAALYLLGTLRNDYKSNVVLTVEGDERDWYFASWVRTEIARDPRYAKFHYEGKAAFQIMPSNTGLPGASERRRYPMTVEAI